MDDIDNTLMDVRRAFRLLNKFQSNILGIVGYIKDKSVFNDLVGAKLYSQPMNEVEVLEDFDGIEVFPKMWGWNFLYGYMFEYYLGEFEVNRYTIERMSIVQVSDDGYAISDNRYKRREESDSFASVEESHSYLVLCTEVARSEHDNCMMYGGGDPNSFMFDFLADRCDYKVCKSYSGKNVFVCKRYDMKCFRNQSSTDKVLADFNDLVMQTTGEGVFRNL